MLNTALTPLHYPGPMRLQQITERYLWITGNLLVIGLFAADLTRLHGLHIGDYVMWGRDFLNVWTGGRLLLAGHIDQLYDFNAYVRFQHALFGPLSPHNYSYPPIALLIGAPLALLSYPVAYLAWTAGGLLIFFLAARPLMRQAGLTGALALVTPAATINIWAGHYGFLIGAAWLLAFRWLETRPDRGVAAIALLAIKPHMALLLPLILLRRRAWRAIAMAGLAVGLLGLLGIAMFGIDLWRHWLFDAGALQMAMIRMPGQFFQTMMPTTAVTLGQQPWTAPLAMTAQTITAIGAILLIWRAAGEDVALEKLCLPAATATFLVLPYAFDYDMTVATLGLMLTLHRRWDVLAGWERAVLGAGFLVPQGCILLAMAGLPLVPVILLAALVVQLRAEGFHQARSSRHERQGSPGTSAIAS